MEEVNLKNILINFVLTFFVLLSTAVYSMSTEQLVKSCADDAGKLICIGYISGATDTLIVLHQLSGEKLGFNLCVPAQGVPIGVAMQVVLQYIHDNPETLFSTARSVVIRAIVDKYKCGK